MDTSTAVSLVVIAAAAVVAPLLAELLRRWRIPGVLFELLLGILVGPALLGWVEVDAFIEGLSQLGLAVLFFMAGYELDLARLRGAPLTRAGIGWAVSLALGLVVGTVLVFEGLEISSLLIGLALTTTAIGTLMPMLRDSEVLPTRFGAYVLAAGAVGEFGPIVAVTVLLSAANPAVESLLLVAFAGLALAVAALAARPQPPKLVELLQRHLSTTTQLPVRLVLFLLVLMVLVAIELGLDNLLGAFAAGMIVRLALSPEQSTALTPRLEALGFGFFIPLFFIVSGAGFDLDALTSSTAALVKLPLFLMAMLVVRGLPALLVYRSLLDGPQRLALALLQATALPMVVVITEIGVATDQMGTDTAAALVGAGMLSVLVFPLAGLALQRRAAPETSLEPATPTGRDDRGHADAPTS